MHLTIDYSDLLKVVDSLFISSLAPAQFFFEKSINFLLLIAQ